MTDRYAILAVAARVYDQDTLSEADTAFLAALAKADRDYGEALTAANMNFGAGTNAYVSTKHLAARQLNAEYDRALAAFKAGAEEVIFAEAAE